MSRPTKAQKFQAKQLTPRPSIRAFCRECNGGCTATCVSPTCDLFAYRMTKVEPGDKASPLRSIRARCLECAGSAEAVRDCRAYKPYLEIPPCPLWPNREGKRRVSPEYRAERRAQANNQRREPGTGATFAPGKLAKYES